MRVETMGRQERRQPVGGVGEFAAGFDPRVSRRAGLRQACFRAGVRAELLQYLVSDVGAGDDADALLRLVCAVRQTTPSARADYSDPQFLAVHVFSPASR